MTDKDTEDTNEFPENLPGPEQPTKKRGRGRPKGTSKRPPCEDLTNKYPLKELVFYEEGYKHKGTGVFHDPDSPPANLTVEAENPDGLLIAHDKNRGKLVALMSFIKLDDGSLKWAYRPVPKVGGGVLMHHDMTLVSPSNLIPLARALEKVAVEWFGGQRSADEARIEYQKEEKKDALGEKIRKEKVFP